MFTQARKYIHTQERMLDGDGFQMLQYGEGCDYISFPTSHSLWSYSSPFCPLVFIFRKK